MQCFVYDPVEPHLAAALSIDCLKLYAWLATFPKWIDWFEITLHKCKPSYDGNRDVHKNGVAILKVSHCSL